MMSLTGLDRLACTEFVGRSARRLLFVLLAALLAASPARAAIVFGSKIFTESVILAEMGAQLVRSGGMEAEHRKELGGTRIMWSALLRGDIQCYPEYTGTLRAEIFAGQSLHDAAQLAQALSAQHVWASRSLGFNNTYVLGMKRAQAQRLGIAQISHLRSHPELRIGLSNEFLERPDGWPGLRNRYALPQADVRGLAHDLAYRGVASDSLDVTDLYSTDAEIAHYGLLALNDDLRFFPAYDALFVCRDDVPQSLRKVLNRLGGTIDATTMSRMNAAAKIDRRPESEVAAEFLRQKFAVEASTQSQDRWSRVLARTREHLAMVSISLGAAIVLALPLGVLGFLSSQRQPHRLCARGYVADAAGAGAAGVPDSLAGHRLRAGHRGTVSLQLAADTAWHAHGAR